MLYGCYNDSPCPPRPSCGPNGSLIILDSNYVIYHELNGIISNLTNLNLPNGSSAQLIFDTIDSVLGVLNISNWSIPYLAGKYTIANLTEFANSVSTELGIDNAAIALLQASINTPNSSINTPTITFELTGTLSRVISGNVNVSAVSGNQLSIQSDGLYSQAQNLSIDYVNKNLTITDGNTVSFASLVNGSAGYLGVFATDPSSTGGQYWWNTTSQTLRINVDGINIKTIITA